MSDIDALEARAIFFVGLRERRCFLMDARGVYWVRTDMTPREAEETADTLAMWLHHTIADVPLGSYAATRLYDDGDTMPR